MMRIKVLMRKNLKLSSGKTAAQSIHAALGLAWSQELDPEMAATMSVVVLEVSDAKFSEAKEKHFSEFYVVRDAGFTEIAPGTETCLAYLEDDPRAVGQKAESPCVYCGHQKDNSNFHFEAPGTNWGAALHHYREAESEPELKRRITAEHSAMFCEHANEVPASCSCDDKCYCKEHTCRLGRPGLTTEGEGFQQEFFRLCGEIRETLEQIDKKMGSAIASIRRVGPPQV